MTEELTYEERAQNLIDLVVQALLHASPKMVQLSLAGKRPRAEALLAARNYLVRVLQLSEVGVQSPEAQEAIEELAEVFDERQASQILAKLYQPDPRKKDPRP